MVVAGIGLGMMMQVFVVAVQNQVPMRAMGSATALTQSARAIGATLGVTAMGVIVNHGLPAGSHLDRGSVHRLPPNLRESLANALQPAFLAASLLCLVTFVVVALWLKQVPLREEVDTPSPVEPAAPSVAPQRAR
jgi:MFS family permease